VAICVTQFPDQKSHATSTAAEKERAIKNTFNIKDKGIITDHVCQLVLKLINNGVGTEHIDSVMDAVCKTLGVEMVEHVSSCSVGRITIEGGVAGDLRIMEKMIDASSKSWIIFSVLFN